MSMTLEEYLKKNKQVQAARKKLQVAKGELEKAQAATSGINRPGVPASAGAQASARAQAAQEAVALAQQQLEQVQSSVTNYYNSNVDKIVAKADKRETADLKQRLEEANAQRQRLSGVVDPRQLAALDNQILDLNAQINKTGKYAPKENIPQPSGDPTGATGEEINYDELVASAPAYIYGLKPAKILDLSKKLKAAGYPVEEVSIYNDALVSAYIQSLQGVQARNALRGSTDSWGQFLLDKTKEKAAFDAAQGGGPGLPQGTVSISTPTEAASFINAVMKTRLGRDATPDELAKFTKELNKEEKKFSSVQRPVKKVVNGVEVTQYVGGIDRTQFLTDLITALPEYSQKQESARVLTEDTLARTARANGLDLNKDFGDVVKTWTKRVENGEDITIFQNLIRGTAKLGMPQNVQKLMDDGLDLDSIYAPYKRVMASNLELTPDSINLNDPLLRTAIGPDKEMSIYDFEKQIRQDNRWQYTNKAREEVSDVALRVLRDFGLMG